MWLFYQLISTPTSDTTCHGEKRKKCATQTELSGHFRVTSASKENDDKCKVKMSCLRSFCYVNSEATESQDSKVNECVLC